MHKRSYFIIIASLLVLLLGACNFPTAAPTEPMDMIRTYAAQTVEALTTEIAKATPTSEYPTPTPTNAEQATQVIPSSETPLPTNTPFPTFTPTATGVCDRAGFIKETVPDKSDFYPGSIFTKTWTIKNTGTCSWNSNYAVVFTGSINSLNAPASQAITTGNVAPGETVVISMTLTAPASEGNYRAEFKLRNASNVVFGTGESNQPFWTEIDVVTGNLNLATNACSAEWSSAAGILDCPGSDGDSDGYAYVDQNPKLENGYQDDEPALWTGPEKSNNGYIKAVFPAQKIPANMQFESIIGCASGKTDCDVIMSLHYREPGGAIVKLDSWREVFDNQFNKISVDLSSLAGKNVQLMLMVEANGSASGDKVHWLLPRLEAK